MPKTASKSANPMSKASVVYCQVRDKILNGEFSDGTKLPPIRKLAKQFGISCPTVLIAMKQLENDGMLSRLLGSGIYVRGEPAAKPAAGAEIEPTQPRAATIADRIASNISHGIYRVGDCLPLQKALRFEYKTSSTTIRQALKLLQDQDTVCRQGNAFVVGCGTSRYLRAQRKAIFVLGDMPHVAHLLQSRMHRDFFCEFEKEIERHGLTVAGYMDFRSRQLSSPKSLVQQEAVGFVYLYSSWRMGGSEQAERIGKQLDALVQTRLPVVLFSSSEVNSQYKNFSFKISNNFYALGADEFAAGVNTGVYLASLGHRRVAYVSLFNEAWVMQRLEGVKAGMERVLGGNYEVQSFHAYVERADTGKGVSFYASHQKVRERLGKFIEEVFEGHKAKNLDRSGSVFRAIYHDILLPDLCSEYMQEYFCHALAQGAFTAWVCADHMIGIRAKDFLEKRNVKVPQDISVIAIDDDPKSMLHGLTCFDFQPNRLGYLAAHCILDDIPIRRDRNGSVECPGRVIERGSTRAM